MTTTMRDTDTGGVLESMILPALRRGGYLVQAQVVIGKRVGGRKHKIDAIATKGDRSVLVSLTWQQVGGTAEQKVPFEVICLAEAVRASAPPFDAAYLVLGGEGWTLREFYTGGGLSEHLRYADRVNIITLESFAATANKGRL
jgi:hypothetical protein